MQKNRVIKYISFVISILLIVSCSEYEKVLKSNDAEYKFRKAMEYYNTADYERASSIFEQIVNVYRGTTRGDTVHYYFAKSYYGQDDYIMAGHYFKELTEIYSRSPFAEESEYLVGYCYYKMSPRPSLDQENTNEAIQSFQRFMYKYPGSKYLPETQRMITELNNKLVEKAYLNAKLYFKLGYYKASIIALRNCLTQYPETKYREELMFLILKSNYLLAENSVPGKRKERYQSTLDEYYGFISEFPESQYKKETEKIYNSTKEILKLQVDN
jgi:outer membrane protein assembly factor BamD